MPEPSATPRRFPRVKILGTVTGAISLLHDVTLLDLSEGGARLEHAGRFALNAICFLRVQRAVRLRSRAKQSEPFDR